MQGLIQGSVDTYYNSDFVDTKGEGAGSMHNTCGITHLKNGEYDHAIADFSKAIELEPENVIAYGQRGIAYYYKGKSYRAVDDFSKS